MSDEMRVALLRGLLHGGLVSTASFLTLLPDPNISWRTLVSGTFLPAVTVLGLRWFGEGWYDTKKAAEQDAKRAETVTKIVLGLPPDPPEPKP